MKYSIQRLEHVQQINIGYRYEYSKWVDKYPLDYIRDLFQYKKITFPTNDKDELHVMDVVMIENVHGIYIIGEGMNKVPLFSVDINNCIIEAEYTFRYGEIDKISCKDVILYV